MRVGTTLSSLGAKALLIILLSIFTRESNDNKLEGWTLHWTGFMSRMIIAVFRLGGIIEVVLISKIILTKSGERNDQKCLQHSAGTP